MDFGKTYSGDKGNKVMYASLKLREVFALGILVLLMGIWIVGDVDLTQLFIIFGQVSLIYYAVTVVVELVMKYRTSRRESYLALVVINLLILLLISRLGFSFITIAILMFMNFNVIQKLFKEELDKIEQKRNEVQLPDM